LLVIPRRIFPLAPRFFPFLTPSSLESPQKFFPDNASFFASLNPPPCHGKSARLLRPSIYLVFSPETFLGVFKTRLPQSEPLRLFPLNGSQKHWFQSHFWCRMLFLWFLDFFRFLARMDPRPGLPQVKFVLPSVSDWGLFSEHHGELAPTPPWFKPPIVPAFLSLPYFNPFLPS